MTTGIFMVRSVNILKQKLSGQLTSKFCASKMIEQKAPFLGAQANLQLSSFLKLAEMDSETNFTEDIFKSTFQC